ncbi:helix-turn-helix domain-containing protein [Nitrosomonas communis]|uniref:HTH IS21-type domain-containing protein n=1 Tax=Nitrosomonas communis TaxID=44574 RepID=A0A1H2ZQ61_9PROT|nr:hypothetical protein SAMN05421882_10882 [Nitrosomonas communis]
MLTQELLVEIHVLHRQGHSIRQIAKILRLSCNTVRHYLRDVTKTPAYHRPERTSKLEPFKPYLLERINAAKPDWIPAVVLFRELQERGYRGKEGILKNWLRPYKAIFESKHPHQVGRIKMSHLGKSGLRSNLASISRMAFLDRETPF